MIKESSKLKYIAAAKEYIAAEQNNQHISLTALSKKYHCKRERISEQIKLLGFQVINKTTGKHINEKIFDCIDTEEKAYWFGFLCADGCVTKNKYVELGIHWNDYDHMQKYRKFLELDSDDSIKRNKNVARVRVHNNHIAEQLLKKGCVHNKSHLLKFPEISIFANRSLVYDFIRGYCDGDGCLRFYQNAKGAWVCDLTITSTKDFLDGVNEFLGIQGGFMKNCSTSKNITDAWSIAYRCVSARKVARLLYENSTIYMDRKYKVYKQFCRFEEESSTAKSSKIERRCDANIEVNDSIAKGESSL